MLSMNEQQTIKADNLTRKYTAFGSFAELVNQAIDHKYTPTLRGWNKKSQDDIDVLRDFFDSAMAEANSTIRAWPAKS